MRSSVMEIKMGAIYKWASIYRLEKDYVSQRLVDRCGFPELIADQITTHWFNTEPIRFGFQRWSPRQVLDIDDPTLNKLRGGSGEQRK